MTSAPLSTPTPATHNLWTIARIQNTLSSEVLIRRFLLDLTHAPAHEVMNVFTAWQNVAATIEQHSSEAPALPAQFQPSMEGR